MTLFPSGRELAKLSLRHYIPSHLANFVGASWNVKEYSIYIKCPHFLYKYFITMPVSACSPSPRIINGIWIQLTRGPLQSSLILKRNMFPALFNCSILFFTIRHSLIPLLLFNNMAMPHIPLLFCTIKTKTADLISEKHAFVIKLWTANLKIQSNWKLENVKSP